MESVNEPPYAQPPDDFQTKWTGQCHCGAVQFGIGRAEPLASKYCHCGDCRTLHGARHLKFWPGSRAELTHLAGTISVGGYFLQSRPVLCQWFRGPRILPLTYTKLRAYSTMQGLVRTLPDPDPRRRPADADGIPDTRTWHHAQRRARGIPSQKSFVLSAAGGGLL
jgi:hypothetical protein